MARKLALLYAVSECAANPEIGLAAAQWAVQFVMHQTRRMLFMASDHVARCDFDAMCKELLRVLREWQQKHKDKPMPGRELNRRFRHISNKSQTQYAHATASRMTPNRTLP